MARFGLTQEDRHSQIGEGKTPNLKAEKLLESHDFPTRYVIEKESTLLKTDMLPLNLGIVVKQV